MKRKAIAKQRRHSRAVKLTPREESLLRERDTLETRLGKLEREYGSLMDAHNSLLTAMDSKTQMDSFSKMLGEMFTEESLDDDHKQYLHPGFEEREGVVNAGA